MTKADHAAQTTKEGAATQSSAKNRGRHVLFADLLSTARHKLQFVAYLELLIAAFTGGVVTLLTCLLVYQWEVSGWVRPVALFCLALVPVLIGYRFLLHRIRPLKDTRQIARLIEKAADRHGLELSGQIVSATELLNQEQDALLGRSRTLCDAYITRVQSKLDKHQVEGSLVALAFETARWSMLSAFTVATVCVVCTAVFPQKMASGWDRLVDPRANLLQSASARPKRPLITDINLQLRYPAYMNREDESIQGSTGEINAPAGTEVILQGLSTKKISSSQVVYQSTQIEAQVTDGRRLTTSFIVREGGTYRFQVTDLNGTTHLDPVAHRVIIEKDQAPLVHLQTPKEDQTVRLEDQINVLFDASDDFGLKSFRVVLKKLNSRQKPFRKTLKTLDTPSKEYQGSGTIPVSELNAVPGDKLSLFIESDDNNTLTGPNTGRSATRIITIFSMADYHHALILKQQELLDLMVDYLAKELVVPSLSARDLPEAGKLTAVLGNHTNNMELAKNVYDFLVSIVEELETDEMSPIEVKHALGNMRADIKSAITRKTNSLKALAETHQRSSKGTYTAQKKQQIRSLSSNQRSIISVLEKHIVYLDDLLQRQRLEEAESLAAELKQKQEALKALVQQYKDNPDDPLRDSILEEIKALKEQLQKLLSRLSEIQRDVPDEYLNREAFDSEDIENPMKDLDQLIEQGKLDEALSSLDSMIQSTNEMLESLDKNKEEYGDDEYREVREKMQAMSEELSALRANQEELEHRSSKMIEAAREKSLQENQKKMKAQFKSLKKKVDRALEDMKSVKEDGLNMNERTDFEAAQARLQDLRAALEQEDFADSLQAAQSATRELAALQYSLIDRTEPPFGTNNKKTRQSRAAVEKAAPKVSEVHQKLRELQPDLNEALTPGQKKKLRQDSATQDELAERARALAQLMQNIGKELPVFSPEHHDQLNRAAREMRQAGTQLKQKSYRKGNGAQQQAMHALDALQDAFDEMNQGQGKGSGGMPLPLPRSGSQQSQGDNEGDGRHSGNEKVELPGADAFQVPDQFRKDILDAMREKPPEEWSPEVKRYYEELVK